MKLHENIESAYLLVSSKKKLEEQKEAIEAQMAALKAKRDELNQKIAEYDNSVNPFKTLILEMMKESKVNKVETGNVVAQIMNRESFSWDNEEAIVNYLKDNKLKEYLTVKFSFNKKELKKGIESDKNLKEALAPYFSEKGSEYLVITDKESFDRMLSHMEENK